MSATATITHEAGVVRHEPRETVAHVRLALVGDQGVGKSTLLRLLDGAFPAPSYEMTTQPAVSHRVVPLAGAAAQVSFIVVDCPGAASLNIQSKPLEALWGGCGAAAVCFDVAATQAEVVGVGASRRHVRDSSRPVWA
jgi:energy-coupling factor transporter ATP-binding protein EcfA2